MEDTDIYVASGFANVPRNLIWTSVIAFSAETAFLLDGTESAGTLNSLLEPLAHLHVVLGAALHDGSIARRLGSPRR